MHIVWILGGAGFMFAILQGGLTVLVPSLGMTWTPLIVSSVMIAVVLTIERVAFGRGPRQAFAALGYGRPRPGAMLAAVIITLVMLTFFPLYSAATGVPFSLKPDWLGLLVGAIVLNGLAEETLFRGFVFGHLRQAGHSFWRAGLVSLAIFGAVHLFLFTTNPVVVALLATLLAIAAAFPYAFLYERAGSTIWAGVIVHIGGHALRLVDIPEAQMVTVASVWTIVLFGGVFLVFAFSNNLLKRAELDHRVAAPAASS
ncbi:MAG TPA: CPBP family intramembrane glutamic endopeptidase [Actinomycetota bacterium]|jgi:membrane protease YdiL (CAAX protease family)|nr:CPBP family intramembrane glutamic endopeptidase [Actinomycetota bacterium]